MTEKLSEKVGKEYFNKTGLKMNRAKIDILIRSLLFISVGWSIIEKRGIASSKYHVKAEKIKHAIHSITIDIVVFNFRLILNHVNANIEYRGENTRFSISKFIPIIFLPDSRYHMLSAANSFTPGMRSQRQAIAAIANDMIR